MGVVIQFPRPYRGPKVREHKQRRVAKQFKPKQWCFADLNGKRPQGHPEVKFGPRGKVELAKGQVWVETHTQQLFVVTQIVVARKNFYRLDVMAQGYRQGPGTCYPYSEANFRSQFEVWDSFGQSRKELMKKLAHVAEHDPTSPYYGDNERARLAYQDFGFDKDGNRVR